jgi:hypothetical protein
MFNVGDEVKVIDGKNPKYGWGSVEPEDTGFIREIVVDGYYVDFPMHPYWKAGPKDLELVLKEPDWEI